MGEFKATQTLGRKLVRIAVLGMSLLSVAFTLLSSGPYRARLYADVEHAADASAGRLAKSLSGPLALIGSDSVSADMRQLLEGPLKETLKSSKGLYAVLERKGVVLAFVQEQGATRSVPPQTVESRRRLRDGTTMRQSTEDSSLYELRRPVEAGGTTLGELRWGFSYEEADSAHRLFLFWFLLIGVLGTGLLGGIISWRIHQQISKPLGRIVEAAGQIASGNLAPQGLEGLPDNEIGRLAESFLAMSQNLRSLVAQIQRFSDEVNLAGESLRGSAVQSQGNIGQISDDNFSECGIQTSQIFSATIWASQNPNGNAARSQHFGNVGAYKAGRSSNQCCHICSFSRTNLELRRDGVLSPFFVAQLRHPYGLRLRESVRITPGKIPGRTEPVRRTCSRRLLAEKFISPIPSN